jgi:acylphosphatase
MTDRVARHLVVHGRVQGVFFRDTTRRTAQAAGVAGWVRNAPDGTVEMRLEGPSSGVERVASWVRAGGPPRATVERVDETDVVPEGHEQFVVRH